ncbi:hypothetical protein O0L34_g2193 [Tuta absoluta]|nr:hypothetical protein O0L34_g2193 [Tuta absoluta]
MKRNVTVNKPSGSGNVQITPPAREEAASKNTNEKPKGPSNHRAEANRWYQNGKAQLEQSGNIKSTIKEQVRLSLEGLYEVALSLLEKINLLEEQRRAEAARAKEEMEKQKREYEAKLIAATPKRPSLPPPLPFSRSPKANDHAKVIQEIGALRNLIIQDVVENLNRTPQATLNIKLEEIKRNVIDNQKLIVEAKGQLTDIETTMAGLGEEVRKIPTYAEKAATCCPKNDVSPNTVQTKTFYARRPPLHSVVVSSSNEKDTSGEVITKLRTAIDARNKGVRIDRLRKARDQKVIIGCSNKEDLAKLKHTIEGSGEDLKVEEVKNKDPLVILKGVMNYNTDENVLTSLSNQNNHLLGDIKAEDWRIVVKYRRKTRNPHASHVILQVSPQIWQRLTEAGRVHVDIQRIPVADQSPLVQCTRCLAYGHGRKFCKESIDTCSHCGGPHLRANCEDWISNAAPSCCNCVRASLEKTEHNALDSECPTRKRWETLARSSVAYC